MDIELFGTTGRSSMCLLLRSANTYFIFEESETRVLLHLQTLCLVAAAAHCVVVLLALHAVDGIQLLLVRLQAVLARLDGRLVVEALPAHAILVGCVGGRTITGDRLGTMVSMYLKLGKLE